MNISQRKRPETLTLTLTLTLTRLLSGSLRTKEAQRGAFMREFEYIVKSSVGLHPRVAGMMMNLVRDFDSDVILMNGEKGGNLQKLLGILHLNIQCGDRLMFCISGRDEEIAYQELYDFVVNHL